MSTLNDSAGEAAEVYALARALMEHEHYAVPINLVQLEAERDRLRVLVQDAFYEGYDDGIGDGHPMAPVVSAHTRWAKSDTLAALTPEGGTDD